ncbi:MULTISPECIES: hypothetical protein [Streptomyces]|uniref:Integral membrane protein n=1 Tax=Streptomyces rubiginosohelvolus TaxID=67362 RepID=A0ABQ3BF39_9ACTN|nr:MULTISPECIES: hypothetical protein [Streptomyces]RUP68290.1 hypothetical protein SSPNP10_12720 [Streptomyces sp. NP10]GGR88349.1 hypothetical protein GCM10010284_21770 [Streptomyces rubiginosohelvolus]GGZ42166.1 hypothetical protein GCM10010328_15040 [Streptomyces pluricolorescens]
MRSRDYDLEFREQAARIRTWGLGLLVLAGLLWGWCAYLLMTEYTIETRTGFEKECAARLFTDGGTANEGVYAGDYCADERDWPEALVVLGLSIPVSLVGTALVTTGSVSRRMSGHAQAMRELDRIAARREKKSEQAQG